MRVTDLIRRTQQGQDLSVDEARAVFDAIFSGILPQEDIATLLLALAKKGETTEEIIGAASSMRATMRPLVVNDELKSRLIDIVGTGGDHHGTLNISTATSLVVSACGVPVAKHGNRAATSKSGSSDVLAQLGVKLDISLDRMRDTLRDAGIVFLFAPNHHPAMKHVADVRKKLGVRTIFNLLGPLTNPAGATRHLIGVYDRCRLSQMADVLKKLGSVTGWIVCGHDSMDEMTTTGPTEVVAFGPQSGTSTFEMIPERYGLPLRRLDELKGDTPEENAAALRALLAGEKSAYRDIVVYNAGAALLIAGQADSVQTGIQQACHALDSGDALGKLDLLIRLTNQP